MGYLDDNAVTIKRVTQNAKSVGGKRIRSI